MDAVWKFLRASGGRLLWLVAGMALLGALQPYHPDPRTDRIIVPAHVVIEREVPARPPKIKERIVYRYKVADLTSTAPSGATLQVQNFCKPSVAVALGDTTSSHPRMELIRSVTYRSSWLPFHDAALFISTASSDGDLIGRDYRVGADFGAAAGDSVYVREPRLGAAKTLVRGVAWGASFWGAIEIGKLIFR